MRAARVDGVLQEAEVVGRGDTLSSLTTEMVNDRSPSLKANGLSLYVNERNGAHDDIYVATRSSLSTGFSNVTNLSPLDSSGRDMPVAISADKCTLYFATTRRPA